MSAKGKPPANWAVRAYYCTRMKNALLKSLLAVGWASGLLAAPACKKIDDVLKPKLPEATQEGKGTFGCLVNGTVWLPDNYNATRFPYTDYDIRTYPVPINAGHFTFDVKNLSDQNAGFTDMTLTINSTSPLAPGVYTLGNGFSASARDATTIFETTPAGTGSVTITKVEPYTSTFGGITTSQSIVSGTFAFTVVANGKTLTVTDGRFDLAPRQ